MKNKLTLFFTLLLMAIIFTKCGSNAEFSEKELIENKKTNQIITTVDKSAIDSLNISESYKKWTSSFYSQIDNQAYWIVNGEISDSILEFFNYLNSDISLNLPIGHLSTIPFTESENLLTKEIKVLLR